MNKLDALHAERDWLDLVLWGTPDQINGLLTRLDETAHAAGWTRDLESEQAFAGGRSSLPEARCYLPPGSPARMWVYRVSPQRVIGGTVYPSDPNRYTQEVADLVRAFRADILLPAVATSGVTAVVNSLGPRSRVPGSVTEALWSVVETGPGVWDAEYDVARKWREFILGVYTGEARFDPDELREWLLSLGWPETDATTLIGRMSRDAALLAEYEDRRQPA